MFKLVCLTSFRYIIIIIGLLIGPLLITGIFNWMSPFSDIINIIIIIGLWIGPLLIIVACKGNGILRGILSAFVMVILLGVVSVNTWETGILSNLLRLGMLCLGMGAILGYGGKSLKSILLGALGGFVIGIVCLFFLLVFLYRVMGMMGMGMYLEMWMPMEMWIYMAVCMAIWMLAALFHRWVDASEERLIYTLIRGILAAALSGSIGFLGYFMFVGFAQLGDTSAFFSSLFMLFSIFFTAFLYGFLALFVTRKTD